jgi:hypothetical protein
MVAAAPNAQIIQNKSSSSRSGIGSCSKKTGGRKTISQEQGAKLDANSRAAIASQCAAI